MDAPGAHAYTVSASSAAVRSASKTSGTGTRLSVAEACATKCEFAGEGDEEKKPLVPLLSPREKDDAASALRGSCECAAATAEAASLASNGTQQR